MNLYLCHLMPFWLIYCHFNLYVCNSGYLIYYDYMIVIDEIFYIINFWKLQEDSKFSTLKSLRFTASFAYIIAWEIKLCISGYDYISI